MTRPPLDALTGGGRDLAGAIGAPPPTVAPRRREGARGGCAGPNANDTGEASCTDEEERSGQR